MTSLLTVITVCRNLEREIAGTIESVLGQTRQDFEWVVMDGGSTDGTVGIVPAQGGSRVNTLVSAPDGGIYDAMNKGVERAQGDYVLFLNGGDRFASPDVLARVMPALGGDDVVYGTVNIVSSSDGRGREWVVPDRVTGRGFFFRHTLSHQATFIRRPLFERLGGYDLSYRIIADRDLLFRAASMGASFRHVPVVVADFLEGGVSSGASSRPAMKAETARFWKAHFPVRYAVHRLRKRFGLRPARRPA